MDKKSFLAIACLFGILLTQFSVKSVHADAEHDWVVTLRQSPGTLAAVEGGWTRDGEYIDKPGGFYTLVCDGTEKSTIIPKKDLRVEPNDADYDIRIWWPGTPRNGPPDVDLPGERIPAPGSKKYTHSSPTYEVIFEVYTSNVTVGGFTISFENSLVDNCSVLYIGLTSTIIVATVATSIYAKHVKRRKEKQ